MEEKDQDVDIYFDFAREALKLIDWFAKLYNIV